MNFKTDIFRAPACQGLSGRYGTLDLVVEITIRQMNVTAKDNALIIEAAYSKRYPLPFAFRRSTELTPKSTDIKAINKTVRAKQIFKEIICFGRNSINLKLR